MILLTFLHWLFEEVAESPYLWTAVGAFILGGVLSVAIYSGTQPKVGPVYYPVPCGEGRR